MSGCAQRFAERSKNDLKAVYDPKSLLNNLRIALTPPTTDGTRLTALVQEFARILGQLPAGINAAFCIRCNSVWDCCAIMWRSF